MQKFVKIDQSEKLIQTERNILKIKNNYSNEYENEKSFDEMNKYEKIEYLANLNKK